MEKKYTTKKLIGEGTYGKVYTGSYKGKRVAIKESNLITMDEINILKTIKGDHIIKIIDVIYNSDTKEKRFNATIIMEKCDIDLHSWSKTPEFATLSIEIKVDLAKQIIMGIYELHTQNISHMDLKPANVMICKKNMRVKLVDFGLSTMKPIGYKYVGTAKYAAPEVRAPGIKLYSPYLADIWSLGATILNLFTGKHVEDFIDIKYNVGIITAVPRDSTLGMHMVNNIDLPPFDEKVESMYIIVKKCLQLHPLDRPIINVLNDFAIKNGL